MSLQAPTLSSLIMEPMGFFELPALLLKAPELARQPRGDGRQIMVIPGLTTNDVSTIPLRAYLTYLGYKPRGWGLGVNRGKIQHTVPPLFKRILRETDKSGEQMSLIGWSLGGVIARELARELPDRIDQVISFGSPIVGGAKYTSVAPYYKRQGVNLDAAEKAIARHNKRGIEVPVTSIYSKQDGVVHWSASIDLNNKHAEHFEVKSTHVGLGFDVDVYKIVAHQLARKF